MAMNSASTARKIIVTATIVVALVAGYLWIDFGYGEVSPQTYQFSKALYSACQNKNEQHLAKVSELLESEEGTELPDEERQWLMNILKRAQAGDWEAAAKQARQMMEDQVKY